MEILEQISFWHWLIMGVVLAILEVAAPGVVFLWMGIAAIVTGLIVLGIDTLSWQSQVLIFAALSVISVIGGRLWGRSRPTETDHPTLNRRGQQYVGRVFTVDEKMVNGMGKLRVDDTSWKISGNDFEAGTKVRVTGVEGTVLVVEKAEDASA